MRLWPWARRAVESMSPAQQLAKWDGAYRWSGEIGPGGLHFGTAGSLQAPDGLLDDLAGLSNARVSRKDALRATAVLRARNLIAGVPATLPLELRDKQRRLDERTWLGEQPNPRLENTTHYAFTFEDLLFEAKSYWRVLRVASEGFPVEAERLDPRSVAEGITFSAPSQVVSEDLQFAPGDPVIVDGIMSSITQVGLPVRPGDVIRFIGPNPPLLVHAAKAIRTILLLDQIASDYSSDPLPFGYFKDASDEETLDDDEIHEVLSKWERARKQRRWGYVESGLELNMLEWPSPQQLQLVQARNHAVLEIARAAGLDPEDVGTTVEGTSRTYQNAEQRRLDLIDFTLVPYLSAVEDRLSMGDITPRGLFAKFDASAFTRADFKSRMEGYKTGTEAGVFLRNEARRRENLPDITTAEAIENDPRSGIIPGQGNSDRGNRPVPSSANGNGRKPAGSNSNG